MCPENVVFNTNTVADTTDGESYTCENMEYYVQNYPTAAFAFLTCEDYQSGYGNTCCGEEISGNTIFFETALCREIKHPLSKSPTRPKKGGVINPPFLNPYFLRFPT